MVIKNILHYGKIFFFESAISISHIIILWFVICCFHEGGHLLTAKLFNFDSATLGYTRYGFPTIVTISGNDLMNVKFVDIKWGIICLNGMITGMLPIFYSLKYFTYERGFTIVIFILYCIACNSDISKIAAVV